VSLEKAVQAYRERCQLFVWEVYEELAMRHKVLLRLLEHLGAAGKPLTAREFADAQLTASQTRSAHTRLTNMNHCLLMLFRNELVRREPVARATQAPSPAYQYRLSDLGEQVLAYYNGGGGHARTAT